MSLAGCGCMLQLARRLLQWKQTRIRGAAAGVACSGHFMRRVAVGLAAASPEGCLEEGLRLYAAKRFAAGALKLGVAVAGGLVHAVADLAWLLWYGREGVEADRARAMELAEQGAQLDCEHCKGLLAIMIMIMNEDEARASQDVRKARHARSLRLAHDSADAGSKWGQLAVGQYHVHVNMSGSLYRQAAAQGLDEAQFLLGCKFDSENGGSDDDKALRWYSLAADQGHPEAMFHVAQYNDPSIETYVAYDDRQVDLNEDVAAGWYKRAAAAGNCLAPFALHRLGEFDEALRWLLPLADSKKAASKERDEYAELCFAIGQCYERSSPLELDCDVWTGQDNFDTFVADTNDGRRLSAADKVEAVRWYSRAAAAGNEPAAFALHRFCEYAEALKWLLPLAEDEGNWSNYWACQKVAQCYDHGLGVPVDKAQAQRWKNR